MSYKMKTKALRTRCISWLLERLFMSIQNSQASQTEQSKKKNKKSDGHLNRHAAVKEGDKRAGAITWDVYISFDELRARWGGCGWDPAAQCQERARWGPYPVFPHSVQCLKWAVLASSSSNTKSKAFLIQPKKKHKHIKMAGFFF